MVFGFGDCATRIYVRLKYATILVVDRWWFHFSKKLALFKEDEPVLTNIFQMS